MLNERVPGASSAWRGTQLRDISQDINTRNDEYYVVECLSIPASQAARHSTPRICGCEPGCSSCASKGKLDRIMAAPVRRTPRSCEEILKVVRDFCSRSTGARDKLQLCCLLQQSPTEEHQDTRVRP